MCLRLWVMRLDDWLNLLPQWRQICGFSPVCTRVCFFMSDFWWNLLLQKLHENGRILAWISIWVERVEDLLKVLPHFLQSKTLTVKWVFLCCAKLTKWLKDFPHVSQPYGRDPECDLRTCTSSPWGVQNTFWQVLQANVAWLNTLFFWSPLFFTTFLGLSSLFMCSCLTEADMGLRLKRSTSKGLVSLSLRQPWLNGQAKLWVPETASVLPPSL